MASLTITPLTNHAAPNGAFASREQSNYGQGSSWAGCDYAEGFS